MFIFSFLQFFNNGKLITLWYQNPRFVVYCCKISLLSCREYAPQEILNNNGGTIADNISVTVEMQDILGNTITKVSFNKKVKLVATGCMSLMFILYFGFMLLKHIKWGYIVTKKAKKIRNLSGLGDQHYMEHYSSARIACKINEIYIA